MSITNLKNQFGIASNCQSLEEVLELIGANAGNLSLRKNSAAYGMALYAEQSDRGTKYFHDTRFVLDQLSRAKAEIDIVAWHDADTTIITAAILSEAQQFVDEETVGCNDWPTPVEVIGVVHKAASKFAAA